MLKICSEIITLLNYLLYLFYHKYQRNQQQQILKCEISCTLCISHGLLFFLIHQYDLRIATSNIR
ncbi:hypothetical protein pb186bvf_005323 [Paramecium bursaria]